MLKLSRRVAFRLWYEFWTRLSRQFGNRALGVHGAIVTPYPGQPYMQALHIRGWLCAAQRGPFELDFYLGGRRLTPDPLTVVCASPGLEADFEVLIEPSALTGLGSGILEAKVGTRQGQSSVVAFTPVRRVSRVPSQASRSEYARVWDSVSSNRQEARVSVAGYSDDAEWQRSGQSTADYVIRCLHIQDTDRVLEIGCGTGRVGRFVAPRCRQWVGADVSANMLGYAREELSDLANVDWIQLNGYNMGNVDSASFDAVYCSAVLMHLDEWERYRYVRDSLRVVRPGGRVFFDNYNLLGEAGWRFFEENCRLDIAVRPPNVSRSSTPQELSEYFRRAGFVEIRVEEGDLFVTVLGTRPV